MDPKNSSNASNNTSGTNFVNPTWVPTWLYNPDPKKAMQQAENLKNATIDLFLDTGSAAVVGVIPGGSIAKAVGGAVVKNAVEELKNATHEATRFQIGPTLEEYTKCLGDKCASPLDTEEGRLRFYEEMNKFQKEIGNNEPIAISIGNKLDNNTSLEPIKPGMDSAQQQTIVVNNIIKISNLTAEEDIQQLKQAVQQNSKDLAALNSQMAALLEGKKALEERENIGHFLKFLEATSIKELVYVSRVASAAIDIHGAINQLSKLGELGAQITAGSILGPIGIIGSAVLGIFSLFSKGPNPTELMMQQLNNISEQVATLHKAMNKHFKNVYDLQIKTLEMITSGFNELNHAIHNQVGGVRIELLNSLSRLEANVVFITRFLELNSQTHLLDKFEESLLAVDQLVTKNAIGQSSDVFKSEIDGACRKLCYWILEGSVSPVVTGLNIWRACPVSTTFNNLFINVDDYRLNFLLAYLAEQSKAIIGDPGNDLKSFQKIRNPLIWYRAVEKYILIKQKYHRFEDYSNNDELQSIITAGNETASFITKLSEDKNFWNKLLGEYYDLLEKIKKTIKDYAEAYSEDLLRSLNRDYSTDPLFQQDPISSLQLFGSPESLINQFNNKSINKLQGKITSQDALITHLYDPNLQDQDFNKFLVFDALSSRIRIPGDFLAAEYLKLISFSAYQTSNMFEQYDIRLEVPLGYDGPLPGNGDGASIRYFTNTSGWKWNLHINLRCQINNQLAEKVLQYAGNFDGLDPIEVGYYFDAKNNKKKRVWSLSSGDEATKYRKHLFKFIVDTCSRKLRNAENRVLTLQEEQSLFSDSEKDNIKKKIHAFYFREREEIISRLLGKNSAGLRQDLIESLRNQLDELNKKVKLIKWYAHLIGKDASSELLNNLVTQEVINKNLRAYKEKSGAEIEAPINEDLETLVPDLARALQADNKINFELISSLKNIESFLTVHPKRLLMAGMVQLVAYLQWKNVLKEQFPELIQYEDYNDYQLKCFLYRESFFHQETHAFLNTILSKSYRKAKRALLGADQQSFQQVTPGEYKEYYKEVRDWILEESLNPLFKNEPTGKIEKSFSTKSVGDSQQLKSFSQLLEDSEVLEYLLDKLKNDWGKNFGLLKLIAKTCGCNFKTGNIASPIVWADGALTMLHVIYNRDLDEVANKTGNTIGARIKDLDEIYSFGINIKNTIMKIGLSASVLGEFFKVYIEKISKINEWIAVEEGKYGVTGNVNRMNLTIYHTFSKDPHSKAKAEDLFNKLEASSLLLKSYVEMCFSLLLKKEPVFAYLVEDLKGKNEMLKYLEEDNEQGYEKNSLKNRMEKYQKQVLKLKEYIIYHIKKRKDLIFFHYYLSSYFKNNWPCRVLKIHGSLFDTGLSLQLFELMEQFIEGNPFIEGLEFHQVVIKEEYLKLINQFLLKFPRIIHLGLSYVGLKSNHLSLLEPIMPQLTYLDLRGNYLGAVTDIDNSFKVAYTLQKAVNLTTLNLSGNEYTNDSFEPIIVAMEKMTSLKTLSIHKNNLNHEISILLTRAFSEMPSIKEFDISYNAVVGNTIEDIFMFSCLIRALPSLTKLNVASTGINAEAIIPLEIVLPRVEPRITIVLHDNDLQASDLENLQRSANVISALENIDPNEQSTEDSQNYVKIPRYRLKLEGSYFIPSELNNLLNALNESITDLQYRQEKMLQKQAVLDTKDIKRSIMGNQNSTVPLLYQFKNFTSSEQKNTETSQSGSLAKKKFSQGELCF